MNTNNQLAVVALAGAPAHRPRQAQATASPADAVMLNQRSAMLSSALPSPKYPLDAGD